MPVPLEYSPFLADSPKIEFRVSAERSIALGSETLEDSCAAAARALRRNPTSIIRVTLEEGERFRAEIARLESVGTEVEKQWSKAALTPELDRVAKEISHFEKGIRFLFLPNLLALLGFPEGLNTSQLATALQAFVKYEWERTSEHWNPKLELDLYSNDRPRLSARVRLDSGETVAFLKRLGLRPDIDLGHLHLLELGFSDLGPDLALKRALPALLSNVAYHASSLEARGLTFDADAIPPVNGWSMGLA